MKTVSSAAFLTLLQKDPELPVLDVRTGMEWRQLRLPGENVWHMPLDRIAAAPLPPVAGAGRESRTLYVLCRTDNRSRQAAEILMRKGAQDIAVVEGGMMALEAHGASLLRGKGLSLERQVRIAAGALVLVGFLGGVFLAPGFYALSGLVGAGLIFAGLTDWCGMALLLAKAPWNR